MSDTKLKFIDLFCGIGGFHQVLANELGHECVLACDIDKSCREVYKSNYGLEPVPDVKKIKEQEMVDFDIICGGFPCQPFSNGGKKKTFDDDRGLLFDDIMRIAKEKGPKFMFLENVKHILKVGNGEVLDYIKKKIVGNGYKLQIIQMSPHDYGIPQQRERVYFVCVRNDIWEACEDKEPIILLEDKTSIKGGNSFNKYLINKEDIEDEYMVKGNELKALQAWDEMIKIFDVDEKISPTIMVNEFYNTYNEEEFKELAQWRQDYITKNRPLYEKYKDQWDAWYDKHRTLMNTREIYAKLEWQVGKIKPNDSIFNYFIQFRQSGIRVKKAQYFPTLVAINQTPVYGKECRYITPREGARLQSFPDSFKLPDNDKHAYKQLGNSVNCSNVKNVIKSTLCKYGYN